MKLKKYKEKNPKKIGIIVFTITCILLIAGVFLYTSFASFETKEEFNIINGTVQDSGDLYFAFYVDDVISKTMPKKGEGYSFDQEKTICTNGASVEWDNENWRPMINNLNQTKTKCTLYFKKGNITPPTGSSAAEEILTKGETEELKFDNTVDNNLRYVGADPNNYVSFNNELWRIIGVFNNIDDGTGKKETRLKIRRGEPIGQYSWDNKAKGVGSSTNSRGSNDWTDSALQIILNEGAYWNRTSGECPSGQNGITTPCDFSNIGLTTEAKEMIGNTLWNLGSTSSYTTSSNGLASHWYTYERGTEVYNGRPTEWIGKIGLIYPSDYGYATSGGVAANRETCLNKELDNWSIDSLSDCSNNNWIHNKSYHQWTLSPWPSNDTSVFYVSYIGGLRYSSANYLRVLYPALYLSSTVKISGGEGTSDNPYTLIL